MTELYKQVKETNERLTLHDKMQQEFINVAAHELRTPIQPILTMVGLLHSKKGHVSSQQMDVLRAEESWKNRHTKDQISRKPSTMSKRNVNDI